jgi:dTDP-glucose 4,6-dehydratase
MENLFMKVLVTGGAGFIGSNFIRMIADGHLDGYSEITVLDKLTYAGVLSNLDSAKKMNSYRFVQGDICDFDMVKSLLVNVDYVINFAAESHVDRSILNSSQFINANVVGVQVLLDAIKSEKRNIRLLQVSTDEVYGSILSGSWNEESAVHPNSPYSASKAGGELLAMSYFRTFGINIVVTRSSNNYGTHHFPEKLIPLFITNIIQGKKLPLYGDGENVRDWLHVDDHCRGLHLALTKGKSGNIYNIGGGRELSNLEITKRLLSIMGKSSECVEFIEDRKGHDFRYSVDWSKIERDLGYAPLIDFEEGLKATVDWYQKNEAWWKPLKSNA